MISDNMGNVVDYGGKTDHCGLWGRGDHQKGVSRRAHRAVRKCERRFPIYRENRRNDRKKTCIIRRLTIQNSE